MKYTALSRSRNFTMGRREASGGASKKNFLPLKGHDGEDSHLCEKCGKVFGRSAHLSRHESVHTGVTPFRCSTCGAAFHHSKSLKMHTKKHCENYLLYRKESSSTVLDQQSLIVPQEQKSFSCILCGSNYLSGSALKKHITQVHEHAKSCRCQVCIVAYASQTIATPLPAKPKDSKFRDSSSKLSNRGRRELCSCSLCSQTFSSSSSLEEHVTLSHNTPKSFTKGLPHSSSKRHDVLEIEEPLSSDLRVAELPSTPVAMKKLTFRCDLCSETFELGNSLSQHYKHSHNRTKTFHCDMCGKGFGGFEYYSVHLRLHMGERPFCCEVCGGSFASKSNLSAHKIRAHSSVDKKPFVCAVCGEAFSEKSDFKEHCMENHSDIFLA